MFSLVFANGGVLRVRKRDNSSPFVNEREPVRAMQSIRRSHIVKLVCLSETYSTAAVRVLLTDRKLPPHGAQRVGLGGRPPPHLSNHLATTFRNPKKNFVA